MRIKLLLFASYAEAVGQSELSIELKAGSTAGDALAAIKSMKGAEKLPPAPLIAVNQKYAKAEAPLADGDEVALIPPVAGG